MLRKAGVQILALAVILALTSSDIFAQTRISFGRGRNSATVSGKLRKNGTRTYIVGAKAGQTLRLSTTGDQVSYEVLGSDYSNSGERSADWSDYILNKTGNYRIKVTNSGEATAFTLTVAIRN
ncbi:MAG: hypothetical protein LC731_04215 [Acidobacteria bacterium]|nr:hypothetical protein [Acidobacteriota bacterium]